MLVGVKYKILIIVVLCKVIVGKKQVDSGGTVSK